MIVIVDYGLGNLNSIANMCKKVGASALISSDPNDMVSADKLILPGVGAFDAGMINLNQQGLTPILNELVLEHRKPILGLCLGMQLMANGSEEGTQTGLGWLDANVVRFKNTADHSSLKIPHMAWNSLEIQKTHPLLTRITGESRFYFVHSYYLQCNKNGDVLAKTNYGCRFDSVVANENIMGVQFHPEKSHRFGMQLLKNFAEVV